MKQDFVHNSKCCSCQDEPPPSPLIVESSLVFLDFFTINQTYDMFSGAFAFQNGEWEIVNKKDGVCSKSCSTRSENAAPRAPVGAKMKQAL